MKISFVKKLNRRVRLCAQLPIAAALWKLWHIFLIKPYTMVDYPRLSSVYDLLKEMEEYGDVNGSIVECGVWNGGVMALMARVNRQYGRTRSIFGFDSFQGLPQPGPHDHGPSGTFGRVGIATGNIKICSDLLYPFESTNLVGGWFEKTYPMCKDMVGNIAFLHLDFDYYESTKYALENLYPQLSQGAVVVIDDYSFIEGCKLAVDEFVALHGILLVKSAENSAYFRKHE